MELQRDINQLIAQWLKLMQPASDHLAKRVDTEFLSVRINSITATLSVCMCTFGVSL